MDTAAINIPSDPVALEIIRQHDQDLELLAGGHDDRGHLIEVTWHRKDGSVLRLWTHATEEAKAYLAARHARHAKPDAQ